MRKTINEFLSARAPLLLEAGRTVLKKIRKQKLKQNRKSGNVITKENLIDDFKKIGLNEGDVILIHSSLRKIGYVDGGAKTVVDALMEVVGLTGTLAFPTSPFRSNTLQYLRRKTVFDVRNTPSQMGAITEYFRTQPGVVRSLNPTEPVSAKGPKAEFLTNGHFGQLTPYNSNSPFFRLTQCNGKILLLGVTLDQSCTNLHTLEDAVDFKYPVYADEIFEVELMDHNGNMLRMKTKAHNPVYSRKRDADKLRPVFEKEGVLKGGRIGDADALLLDAYKMHETMVKYYLEKGITMYTPHGEPR